MAVRITVDKLEQIQRELKHIPDGARKVASRAINRAMVAGKTATGREASKLYNVRHGDVVKTVVLSRAVPNNLQASVRSRGKAVELIHFGVRPKTPQPAKRPRLLVSVRKDSGYKPIKGAFVARGGSGMLSVFNRQGPARLPIRRLYGPSIPEMLGEKSVSAAIENRAQDVLQDRLNHEIKRMLGEQ